MRSGFGCGRMALLGLGLVGGLATPAAAQVPPEVAEINACLCLQRSYTALAADMNAKNQAYAAAGREVADLDAQLARERASVNVNSPDSIARVKALLERRDAASNSLQPAYSAAAEAVSRYNARVGEYNARCANRPFNSALVAEIQARLVCPPRP
jgi:uncharacterized protein YfiM (DUF2279 family)